MIMEYIIILFFLRKKIYTFIGCDNMLKDIKGIGDKTLSILNKLGIYTEDDLINYYPYRYNVLKLTPLSHGEVTVVGIVETAPIAVYIKRNLNKLTFRVQIDNYLVNVVIFNRAYMKQSIKRGSKITIIGEYDEGKNTITASDIRLKEISGELIEPVYHLTSGISSRNLHSLIMNALNTGIKSVDYIPDYLVEEYDFPEKNTSLRQIHNPLNLSSIKKAIVRFKYEELFKFMFKINYLKGKRKDEVGLKRNVDESAITTFIDGLSFELTVDQKNAIKDIVHDLRSSKRMNRLLLGDVGSGKTIVAVAGIYYNFLSGYQSALLVPTEILANQHFLNITKTLLPYGIRVELLRGGMSKKERNKILDDLKSGEIDLLIGTHAVLQNDVEFENLGFVITDEQHRFGVAQRSNLQNKGSKCDILYMSATPIPRTYALTIYGDMDISLIKTKPQGRKEIKTELVSFKDLKSVLSQMLEEIKKGHQVYIVSPMIETDDESDLTDVITLKQKIDLAYNNKIPNAILHGRLKSSEKETIMENFKSGEIKILISTTVIEVGVDVPNATMMVIFNAERFGLATIHQLRGRIGRNDLESKCILVSDKAKERLKVLVESSDGFYISECDFKMRGEGDLFGIRQSGEQTFKIADIRSDVKILTQANVDSAKFIQDNIENNFPNNLQFINIVKELEHID